MLAFERISEPDQEWQHVKPVLFPWQPYQWLFGRRSRRTNQMTNQQCWFHHTFTEMPSVCVCVCLCPPRYVCSRSRQSRAPKTRMQSRLVGVKKKRKKLSLLFLYLFKYLSFGLFVRSPWALGTYRGMFHYFLIFIVFFYRLKFQNVANPDISGDFSTLLKELIHQFVLKVSNIRRKKKTLLSQQFTYCCSVSVDSPEIDHWALLHCSSPASAMADNHSSSSLVEKLLMWKDTQARPVDWWVGKKRWEVNR